ncbi:MAG: hypothetical protein A2X35_08705 [Elusimicrobia bacterium GWA2_61_42]|nr:MAG: hypothetical protein A2X35_08705 [Elusimicrobia bacterium GWA2_61_42]OGR77315.1 MAG: hypothetical protein A2X38_09255 [Elusimicrobia bacterium GWC2_61_25]
MKKHILLVFAAAMSVSAAARAAEVNYDGSKAGGLDNFIDVLDIVSDLAGNNHHPGPQPPQHPVYPQNPGHQQPGQPHHPGQPPIPHNPGHQPPPPPPPQPHHPGYPQQPGYPQYPNHPLPPPQPYNPPPSHYNFGGYRESCRTLSFNAQSPLSVTEEMILEEYGDECQSWNYGGPQHCRPVSNYHKRKVTVNIGSRKLEPWETERLEVCLRSPKQVEANISGMLYDYSVASRNDDGLFRRVTILTLTPGAKKPAQPDGKELEMTFAGITTSGDVRLTLKDNRADYFRGEKITITADGMNIPAIGPNMPVDQLLGSFVKFNVTAAFDVAGTYELKLMDAPKPGKYIVTLRFFRSGPLSSGAEASSMETFELK